MTHGPGFEYQHYGIHVGQTDRLTFFGNPKTKIVGHFVDCRKNSPTLHKYAKLEFSPDPTRLLYIDRGIAHTFDGLENITTRDEPIWYLSHNNPDYNIANDVINVDRHSTLDNFPAIQVNAHKIPRVAYEFMLKLQHETLREMRRYPSRFPILIDGERRYVNLKPKNTQNNGVN